MRSAYFDIHAEKEGEMDFVIVALNAVCPDVLEDWRRCGDNPSFESNEIDRWEIVWCIDDTEGFTLANKVYSYIENFGFDVEIVEEKA